jgi:VWFA-related protein
MISATAPRRLPVRHKIQRRFAGSALLAAGLLFSAPLFVTQAAPNSGQQTPRDASIAATPSAQFQVQVPLVLEDLVVLDHDGNPAHGLKPSDFTVTENGKLVTFKNFEEHAAQPAGQAVRMNQLPALGPNIFTNMVATPSTDSLNILLFDALNTPMTDQAEMRQQMLEYLKTLPPGIPIAVFGLGSQLYMLNGFSTNPKVLAAAVEMSKDLMHASPLLDNPVANLPTPQMSDFVKENLDLNDPGVLRMLEQMRQFELETKIGQTSQRVQHTMLALSQLARYLSGLPGRKNVIWFSGSFPLNFIPDPSQAQPFMAVADFQDEVRKTTDLLARSEVAVYPVDGRMLFTNPAFDASQKDNLLFGARSSNAPLGGPGVLHIDDTSTRPAVVDAVHDFAIKTSAEHATMTEIAENTGGKAFFDTNDLTSAVEKAVNDGSNYYTVAYTPPDPKFDGTYRRIEVKIDRPDLRLSYRKSYIADNPNEAWQGKKVLPQSTMQAAMMFGSPAATQLLMSVQTTPEDKPVNDPSLGTKPDSKLMKPPYRRYNLVESVDVHNVLFTTTSDGVHHGKFEFAALIYDSDGQLLNSSSNRMSLDFPPDRYAAILDRGLRVGQTIEAPLKGSYFLRVGIYDANGDRVGAVEIPTASIKAN